MDDNHHRYHPLRHQYQSSLQLKVGISFYILVIFGWVSSTNYVFPYLQIYQHKTHYSFATKPATTTANNTNNNVDNDTEVVDIVDNIVQSDCACVSTYLTKLKALGIQNNDDDNNKQMSYEDWEKVLCRPPLPFNEISNDTLILGVGPGTTATRSFALGVSLLLGRNSKVLHWFFLRHGSSSNVRSRNEGKDKFAHAELIDGMVHRNTYDQISNERNFAKLFKGIDGVFDQPYPMYALDILRYFPTSLKVIMTHRNPEDWYESRSKFCFNRLSPWCGVPFLARPLGIYWKDNEENRTSIILTKQQAIASFTLTEQVIKCMVGQDRYLHVDAWNPPPANNNSNNNNQRSSNSSSWMPIIANFLNVTMPTQCNTLPRETNHNLSCKKSDVDCIKCINFVHSTKND